MNFNEVFKHENTNFNGVELPYFLLGLLSAFENRFQAVADKYIGEISWKQFFAIICIKICKENPSIKELAEIIGSSHQNVKQLLLKLEKKDFVNLYTDPKDRRKLRVELTDKCINFCEENDEKSIRAVDTIFAGISEDQLRTTIQTIMQMEDNLQNIQEESDENIGDL
ncbi:MAG: MarR family winged helix-turn-helix transcriptional regulator [Acetivibrionales bacterium]|jgi:DNA-binding MarR family transcriptional regulator